MITVLGSNGQLGHDVCKYFGDKARGLTGNDIREGLNLPDHNKYVLNTIAKHKPLEDCEKPQHIKELLETNIEFLYKLADYCIREDRILINISTNFVFGLNDEAKFKADGFSESDRKNPMGMYAMSKLWGEYCLEHLTRTRGLKFYNLRVAALHGTKGTNFIEGIYNKVKNGEHVSIVDDQYTNLTTTMMVNRFIEKSIIETKCEYGHYNVASPAAESWFKIACWAMRDRGLDITETIFRKKTDDLIRPKFSNMNCYKAFNRHESVWSAIREYNRVTKGITWDK